MHLAADTGFLPLTQDKPARAPTPRSVPRAACLQNGLQLSCRRSKPSCTALHLPSAFLWRGSMQRQLLCRGWALNITKPVSLEGFLWSKDYTGDTYDCAKETAFTGTTVTTDFVWKGKKRLLLLFRRNLAPCFVPSFWSISLPSF